jgi:ABC-type transport system substrate-binding protein
MRVRRTGGLRGTILLGLACVVVGAGIVTTASAAKPPEKPLVIGIRQVGQVYDLSAVLPAEVSAVAANVTDYLWTRGPDGKVAPSLATRWQWSSDGKTLTIQLRPNVRFSTGDLFTAEDVVFSWNRLKANGFSDRLARTLIGWEIKSPTEIVARFAAPELSFIPQLGPPIMSKRYFERVGEARFKSMPVGTGPYKFQRIRPGESAELVVNPRYWGKKPTVKRVIMRSIVDDTTRIAALKTGEADIVMQVPYQKIAEVRKTTGLKTVRLFPSGSSVFMVYKHQSAQTPWSDPRVRAAMSYAIDKKAITERLLRGAVGTFGFLARGDLGYDPTIYPYEYNPAKARQLLQQAGYGGGFSLDLPYIAGAVTGVKETAEAVALYLRQVGINATPRALEGPEFVQFVMGASRDPSKDYVAIFIGALAGQPEPTTGLVNMFSSVTPFAWYRNGQVNGLILRAAATVDDAERAELIKRIQRLIIDDFAFTKLWDAASVYGMKKCIRFKPTRGPFDLMWVKDVDTSQCRR